MRAAPSTDWAHAMTQSGWSRIETRHLVALRAVARERSFGDAAMALGYTQSAISQQIASLERSLGQRLIERPRGRGPVGLTDAGVIALRHADAVFCELEALATSIEELRTGMRRLRVGTYQSVGTTILPAVVRAFADAHPETQLDVAEPASDDEVFAMVRRAELDLSFALLPPLDDQIEAIELLRDPYVLVVAADSPLADRCDPIDAEELDELPLIGFKSCRGERWLQAHLEAIGGRPDWIFRSDDNATIQAMAAAGVGCALVPRLTVDPTHSGTVTIDLGGVVPPRRLGLVWHAGRPLSAVAETFISLARDATDSFRRRSFVSGAN